MGRYREDRCYHEPRGLVSFIPSSSLHMMGVKGEEDHVSVTSSAFSPAAEEDREFAAFEGRDLEGRKEEERKRRRRRSRIRRSRLVACLGYFLGERRGSEKVVDGERKIYPRSAVSSDMPSREEGTKKTGDQEQPSLSLSFSSSSPFTSTPPPLQDARSDSPHQSSPSSLSRCAKAPGGGQEGRETPPLLPSSCCSSPSPDTRVTEGYEIPLPEAFHVLYQLHSQAKISLPFGSSDGASLLLSSSLSSRKEEEEEDAGRASSSRDHSAVGESQTSLHTSAFEISSQSKASSLSVSSRSSLPSSSSSSPDLNVEGSLPTPRRYPRRSTRIASSSFACAQNSSSSSFSSYRNCRRQARENEDSQVLRKEASEMPDNKGSSGKGRKTPYYPCLDSQQIPLLLPPPLGKDSHGYDHDQYKRISKKVEERKQSPDGGDDVVRCVSREGGEQRSSFTLGEHRIPASKEDEKSLGALVGGQQEEEEEEQGTCREKTDGGRREREGRLLEQDDRFSLNMRTAKTCEDTEMNAAVLLSDGVSLHSRFHSSPSPSSERESKVSPVFFVCKDWSLGELLRDPVGLYTLGKLPISPCRKWRVSYSSFSSSSVCSSSAVSSLSTGKEEGEEEERHTVRARGREKEKVIRDLLENNIERCREEAERVQAKYLAEDGEMRDFREIEKDRKTGEMGKKEERRSDTCDGKDNDSVSSVIDSTAMKIQEAGQVKKEESREKEVDRERKMGMTSQELNKRKRKTPRKPAYILHREAEFATKAQYLTEWKETLKSLEEDRCMLRSPSCIKKAATGTLRKERREDQEAGKKEEKKPCQENVANEGEEEVVQAGFEDSRRRFVGVAVVQALRLLPLWTLLRCIDTLECM